MSDQDRLNAVLGKLGGPYDGPVADSSSVVSTLTSLLKAVDETVLARNLNVTAGKVSVVLHASKRRLLGVSGAVEADFGDGGGDGLTKLGEDLADIFLGKEFSIKVTRPDEAPDLSAIGVGIQELALAWADAGGSPHDIGQLCENALSAVQWNDGKEIGRFGDPDLIGKEPSREALRALSGHQKGLISSRRQDSDNSAVFLWDDVEEALLIIPGKDLSGVVNGWKA